MGFRLSRRVVVIGAGVVGLSSAYHLVNRGYEVTVLDQSPAPDEGCSHGNGGIVVPSHFVPLAAPGMIGLGLRMLADPTSPFGFMWPPTLESLGWIARFVRKSTKAHVAASAPLLRDLNLASRAEYERLNLALGADWGFGQKGLLMLCQKSATLEGEAHLARDAAKLGLKAVILTKADLPEYEPEVETNAVGGVWFADDAHLSPSLFMAALRRHLSEAGVRIESGVDVTAIRDGEVTAGERSWPADLVVLAAGAWSGELATSLKVRLPMLAGRGYGYTISPPPQRFQRPAILVEARVAVTPMPEGTRFVGTMELGPPRIEPNPNRIAGMQRSIGEMLPGYATAKPEGDPWIGLRPCPPDGLPYLGRLKRQPNVIVAAGHAMMGMSLGPITGRLVGELADGESPSIEISLLDPERYA